MKHTLPDTLLDGYRNFYQRYTSTEYAGYRVWAGKEQKPKVMFIACSDSRANPAILTQAKPGEIFTVHNVANLVPPYKEGKNTHHSTSSALEFAVNSLHVEHVIILGHSNCGGIKALMQGIEKPESDVYSFIGPWVNIAHTAKEKVLEQYADSSAAEQFSHCEKEALLVSLNNLHGFPWVKSAVAAGQLTTHAWHFDIASGDIKQYLEAEDRFSSILE